MPDLFPSLPSGSNPYVGAAADAGAGALHFAQALRSAAEQKQALAAKQQQQTFEEQLKQAQLLNEGWQVYQPSQNTETQSSGLKTRDYTPPPEGLVTFPATGMQMFRPAQTAKEKEASDKDARAGAQQTYGDTTSLLEKGAQPLNFTPVPGTHPNAVTPPGSGGQYFDVPTPDQSLASKLDIENAHRAPHIDTEHFSSPVAIDASGQATEIKLPAGVTHNEKADKPEKFTYNHFTDDNGRVSVTRIGEDGVPQQWNGKTWGPLAAGATLGAKRKDPDAAAKPSAQQVRMVTTRKATGLKQAETAYAKAMQSVQQRIAKVKAQPAPGANQKAQQQAALATLLEEKKSALDTLNKAKQATQDEYEESLGNLGYSAGHFDYSDQAQNGQAQTPAAAPPQKAQQGPAQAGGKQLTDSKIANYYLKRAAGRKDLARKLAAQDGWSF